MIAFIDVPPGTMFLPQAAELDDGRLVTFFSPLIEKLQQDGGTLPPAYPESTTTDEVIADGGRPRWIDYRMTFGTVEVPHLRVVAHGDYDTGVFAYNLIRPASGTGLGSSAA